MRQKSRLLVLLLLAILLSGCAPRGIPPSPSPSWEGNPPGSPLSEEKTLPTLPAEPTEEEYFKGIWLSQFDLSEIYLSGGEQREREDYVRKMEAILEEVKRMGFNAVFVQVHPYGDSFYPSEYFPDSRFVSGAYGKRMLYDPFAITVELCKALGLELHAWINPMRLMKKEELLLLEEDQLLRQWMERGEGQVAFWQGRGYLDPAFSEARELIASAARELCVNYDVDGVHIDDYFYPTTSEDFDRVSYESYRRAGGGASLSEFRRENLSSLVALLYRTVKDVGRGQEFSISPAGNVENVVETMYADLERWCGEEGFADTVIPQLYYGFRHEKCPFDQMLRRWRELCQGGKVRLVIGLTFTKVGIKEDPYAGSGRSEWAESNDILRRCALAVREAEDCAGLCVFSYSYLRDPLRGTVPKGYEAEVENFLSVLSKMNSLRSS